MPVADFDLVFSELRKILAKFESKLVVVADDDKWYYLNTKLINPKNKKPVCFGMVARMKNYVSYHLMPVYGCSELLEQVSPELKAHMQGKACFNFKVVDKKLFKELARLTKAGFERFQSPKMLELLSSGKLWKKT
jgi:hypothetical protein